MCAAQIKAKSVALMPIAELCNAVLPKEENPPHLIIEGGKLSKKLSQRLLIYSIGFIHRENTVGGGHHTSKKLER